MRVKAAAFVPWEGSATERDTFDYMIFMGDLVWSTKTNPPWVYSSLALAQFLKCPELNQVVAAHWLLRYIRSDMGGGLTFHGSDFILNQFSPHRHFILGPCDAVFDHADRKAVPGTAISTDGAAIAVVARRQSTTSQRTAGAEVKDTFFGRGAPGRGWSLVGIHGGCAIHGPGS